MMLVAISMVATGFAKSRTIKTTGIKGDILFSQQQIGRELKVIGDSGKILNPVTMSSSGKVYYCNYADWRSGFFPGSLWYLYELTGKEYWAQEAEKFTESIEKAKKITYHHDIGFIINCSFGNGLRLKNIEAYKDVIITAAKSLSTRFRPAGGVLQSWNVTGNSWQAKRGWECPVIIDNMMNLELMFKATQLSGDSTYYRMAVSHADRTLKEQFRPDGSCYHVVDYGLIDGKVHHRQTAQGYSDESCWSRGQAWAIYGYTMCYRFTRFKRYLNQAIKTFHMMKNKTTMPDDLIPYWDMDAPKIPNEPRDVSSAAVIASALYELSTIDIANANEYKNYADRIMNSLSSDKYRAQLGANGNFLLMHSVGSIPHGAEVDKPLNYADYYYLEALTRRAYLELYFQKNDK
ncbi:MAG TPA: glucuronyl hydrolase [Prevotella sp.]|nr:glucuronyl hydrolase [Prevotella sp.]